MRPTPTPLIFRLLFNVDVDLDKQTVFPFILIYLASTLLLQWLLVARVLPDLAPSSWRSSPRISICRLISKRVALRQSARPLSIHAAEVWVLE